MADIEIISFGYLHGPPPKAHITLDLRHHFRDPHVRPELRDLTANDAEVRGEVLSTPGILQLITLTQGLVGAYIMGPTAGRVRVAVGCAGGRHRAATVAAALAQQLETIMVTHRDLMKPVVNRNENGAPRS